MDRIDWNRVLRALGRGAWWVFKWGMIGSLSIIFLLFCGVMGCLPIVGGIFRAIGETFRTALAVYVGVRLALPDGRR